MTPAHRSGAASRSGTASGRRTAKSSGTVSASAYPPSTVQPVNSGASQRFSSPRTQNRHPPQARWSQATPTRSPGWRRVHPVPSASTTPTAWCPGTTGRRGRSRSPSTTCRSVRQHPHAETRTRTSPGAGSGSGRSSSTSGRSPIGAGPASTMARWVTEAARGSTSDPTRCGSWHRERCRPLDGGAAVLLRARELEVDPALAVVLVPLGHRALAGEGVARPDLLAELEPERPHVLGAEPVGGERPQDAGLEHPDREHRREAGGLGVLLVVVDRVEVARRALVADEVGAGERPDDERIRGRALPEVVPCDTHDYLASVGGLPVS